MYFLILLVLLVILNFLTLINFQVTALDRFQAVALNQVHCQLFQSYL
jgi:hypothetical protein